MRNLLFLITYVAGISLSLRRPFWGLLFYYWISLVYPHRYAWGSLQTLLPYAKIAAGLCIASAILHVRELRMVNRLETYLMFGFLAVLFVSSLFANYPMEARSTFWDVSKVFVMAFMAILILNRPLYIKQFLMAIVLFVGFIGIKGAIFALATGGAYRIYGPEHSPLADNNDVGLAMVSIIPICFGLLGAVKKLWKKVLFAAVGLASIVSCIFTYSRGAFVGLLVIGLSYVFINRHRLFLLALLPALAILGYHIVPEKYKARILTIKTYELDRSAQERLNSWGFAIRIASRNFLGGGFGCYTPELYYIYAPDPSLGIYLNDEGELEAFTAHSIYFQTLAEHGFPGLMAFLACLGALLISMFRVTVVTARLPDAEWMNSLSRAMIISVVGYMASGAFLSRAYFEVFWALFAAGVAIKDLLYRGEIEDKPAIRKELWSLLRKRENAGLVELTSYGAGV